MKRGGLSKSLWEQNRLEKNKLCFYSNGKDYEKIKARTLKYHLSHICWIAPDRREGRNPLATILKIFGRNRGRTADMKTNWFWGMF